jgi:hypothetical protein
MHAAPPPNSTWFGMDVASAHWQRLIDRKITAINGPIAMNERELQERLAVARDFTLRQRLLQALWKLQRQLPDPAHSNEKSSRSAPATPRFATKPRQPLAT